MLLTDWEYSNMKNKERYFYKELPDGYVEDYVIDAVKSKKTAVLLNVIGLILTVLSGAAIYLFRFGFRFPEIEQFKTVWGSELFLLLFLVSMITYLILHELVHGIVYKLLTREKLTFGISWSCAFCGVPHIYVTKKCALLSILAPFMVFSIIFVPLCFIFNNYVSLLFILLFAIHFGGCVGDLYGTLIMLFKYKGKTIFMNDTGPKQSFFVKH